MGGACMGDNQKPLEDINATLQEVVKILKPKPKQVNKLAIIGWLLFGLIALYILATLKKLFY
jgi:hypothetical protein